MTNGAKCEVRGVKVCRDTPSRSQNSYFDTGIILLLLVRTSEFFHSESNTNNFQQTTVVDLTEQLLSNLLSRMRVYASTKRSSTTIVLSLGILQRWRNESGRRASALSSLSVSGGKFVLLVSTWYYLRSPAGNFLWVSAI